MLNPEITKKLTDLPCPGILDLSHLPEKDRPASKELRGKAYLLGHTISIKVDAQR